MSKTECHCGKDGHALNSINCPVHGHKSGVLTMEEMKRAYDYMTSPQEPKILSLSFGDWVAGIKVQSGIEVRAERKRIIKLAKSLMTPRNQCTTGSPCEFENRVLAQLISLLTP